VSQMAGIIGMYYHSWLELFIQSLLEFSVHLSPASGLAGTLGLFPWVLTDSGCALLLQTVFFLAHSFGLVSV
jgi:hypothetical protein